MKTSKSKFFLQDIRNRSILSLKLILKNKITIFILAISIISTFFILQQLNVGVQLKSNIPIGIINLDILNKDGQESELSKEVVEGLSNIETISVQKNTFDSLYEQLIEGEIYSIFVINEGFEQRLKEGEFSRLITVYQGSESKTARLIKDIVAGELMYRICLTKGNKLYQSLEFRDKEKLSIEEYNSYADSIRNSNQFDFQFDMQFVNTKDANHMALGLDNQILYRQLIGAIFAMLLSFIILYATSYLTLENSRGLSKRVRLSDMNKIACFVGNLCSICLLVFVPCVVFSGILCYYIGTLDMFASIMKVSYCYTVILGILFILLGAVLKNIISFQLFGAFIILLFGLAGFYSMIGGGWQNFISLTHLSPNSWFIKKIADIILYH